VHVEQRDWHELQRDWQVSAAPPRILVGTSMVRRARFVVSTFFFSFMVVPSVRIGVQAARVAPACRGRAPHRAGVQRAGQPREPNEPRARRAEV
jgi:hypothetical protein